MAYHEQSQVEAETEAALHTDKLLDADSRKLAFTPKDPIAGPRNVLRVPLQEHHDAAITQLNAC